MAEKKASGKLARAKGTQKSAKSTAATGKKSQGFTDEERAAMKERAQELKAAARADKDKAVGESDVLAKIAEMLQPDRALGERLHAIITASAPALSPKIWYGMPAYAKDSNRVARVAASASRVRSTRNLDEALNRKHGIKLD